MKANIIDGKIKLFSELPKTWNNYLNFQMSEVELQQQEGFFDVVIPEIDSKVEKLGELYWDAELKIFTYTKINKTTQELTQLKESLLVAKEESPLPNRVIKRLLQTLVVTILSKTAPTKQDIDDISLLYPQYRAGVTYKKLDRFNHDNKFYEVTSDFIGTEVIDSKNIVDMYTKYQK